MTNQERLWALVELARKKGSPIDRRVKLEHLLRAVDGDLIHIGDALLAGHKLLTHGYEWVSPLTLSAEAYAIKEKE